MQEAEITEDGLSYQRERFPSVVTTDDLVFELGKQVVDRLNKERLLESILKKAQVAETQVAELKSLQIEREGKCEALENSNSLYEKNNRGLDEEIVKLRGELAEKDRVIGEQQRLLDIAKAETEKHEEKQMPKSKQKKPLKGE